MTTMQELREIPLRDAGVRKTRSICGYCGVGCSVDILSKNNRIVGIQPAMDGPANLGALCVKGQFAFDYVHHPERLTQPLVRGADGALHPTSWRSPCRPPPMASVKWRSATGGRRSMVLP